MIDNNLITLLKATVCVALAFTCLISIMFTILLVDYSDFQSSLNVFLFWFGVAGITLYFFPVGIKVFN